MQIPNIFKARTGAIQLADLDANFDILQVTVNRQEELYNALDSRVTSLTSQIANFSAVPIGCIVMWSGTISTIPERWRLCDGANGTPDLRDKFVIGAKVDSVGKAQTTVTGSSTYTGGSKDNQLVSHTHTATNTASSTASTSTESDSWSGNINSGDANLNGNGVFSNAGGGDTISLNWRVDTNNQNRSVNISHTYSHDHDVTIATSVSTTISTEGTVGTNGNLPPYYALAFIMKV